MIEKRTYSIESTLKPNMLKNYNRCLFETERINQTLNKIRDENIICIHMNTENFDKYFNTKYGNVVFLTRNYNHYYGF